MTKKFKIAVVLSAAACLLGTQAFAQGGSTASAGGSRIGRDNHQTIRNQGRIIMAAIGNESSATLHQAEVTGSRIGRDNIQDIRNEKDIIGAAIGNKTTVEILQGVVR